MREISLSYCIPCKDRTDDLKKSLITVIAAAKKSPPIEIVILDYNSEDGLEEYIKSLPKLKDGNRIVYTKYTFNKYYHNAHARNLSVLAASGDYIVISNTETLIFEDYFKTIRNLLSNGVIWMTPTGVGTLLVVQKKEFIEAGGYDERFEFYGPDDKEIVERLQRRGAKYKDYPRGLFFDVHTPNEKKIKNYRLKLTKREMGRRMRRYIEENRANNLLVANPDGWGKQMVKINGCISNNTSS